MANPQELTLATLGGGALMESIASELRKICANISDPNMKKTAKRKLAITIEIKPEEKGERAAITYCVKSAMPGPDPGVTMAYIAVAPGSSSISLFEMETHPPLFEPEKPLPGIEPLKKQA